MDLLPDEPNPSYLGKIGMNIGLSLEWVN